MFSFKCLFGFHDWKSTAVGEVREAIVQAGPGLVLHQMGRVFWDNECRRCGRLIGPTWAYEKGADVPSWKRYEKP